MCLMMGMLAAILIACMHYHDFHNGEDGWGISNTYP